MPKIIDISQTITNDEIHEILSNELGLPEGYGRNWDEFNDSFNSKDALYFDSNLTIKMSKKRSQLKAMRIIREIIEQYANDHTEFSCTFEYCGHKKVDPL